MTSQLVDIRINCRAKPAFFVLENKNIKVTFVSTSKSSLNKNYYEKLVRSPSIKERKIRLAVRICRRLGIGQRFLWRNDFRGPHGR